LRYYMCPMAGKRDNSIALREDTRLPAYSFHEAAKYLRSPVPALRSWSIGLGKPISSRESAGSMVSVCSRCEERGVERPLIGQGFQTNGHFCLSSNWSV
jgi:hypothetical protein